MPASYMKRVVPFAAVRIVKDVFRRCIVFLLLPQFFSKRGRQALLAYAFILAITGPAKNTLNNMGILSESLACGQVSKSWKVIQTTVLSYFLQGTIKTSRQTNHWGHQETILCYKGCHKASGENSQSYSEENQRDTLNNKENNNGYM